jgi:hypothetical protein
LQRVLLNLNRIARVICTGLLAGDNKLDHEGRAAASNSGMAVELEQLLHAH